MEKPDDQLIIRALWQLNLLNAIDNQGEVTSFGREVYKYPMEPHFSKSLMMAQFLDCFKEVLIIVSLLSAEHIWMRIPVSNQDRFMSLQSSMQKLSKKSGDHITYLSIYKKWRNYGRSFEYFIL